VASTSVQSLPELESTSHVWPCSDSMACVIGWLEAMHRSRAARGGRDQERTQEPNSNSGCEAGRAPAVGTRMANMGRIRGSRTAASRPAGKPYRHLPLIRALPTLTLRGHGPSSHLAGARRPLTRTRLLSSRVLLLSGDLSAPWVARLLSGCISAHVGVCRIRTPWRAAATRAWDGGEAADP
jgi:hypothetical protein